MGDADELLAFNDMILVAEGDHAIPVLKPDCARGLEAGRGEALEFVEEEAAARIDPAFWHELKASPHPSSVWYHDTTSECRSTEAPARLGRAGQRNWAGPSTVSNTSMRSGIRLMLPSVSAATPSVMLSITAPASFSLTQRISRAREAEASRPASRWPGPGRGRGGRRWGGGPALLRSAARQRRAEERDLGDILGLEHQRALLGGRRHRPRVEDRRLHLARRETDAAAASGLGRNEVRRRAKRAPLAIGRGLPGVGRLDDIECIAAEQ
jgi:hypothetical protein